MPIASTQTLPRKLHITAGDVAALVHGRLEGPADLTITGVAGIESGNAGDLTFVRGNGFARAWPASNCSAVLVTRGVSLPAHADPDRAVITVANADTAFAAVLGRLDPGVHTPPLGVHPTAVIHESARVDPTAAVGPHCTIGPGASVGPDTVLIAGVHIGAGALVGGASLLHPGVVIGDRCTIGERCTVHPNAVIGADGFGFIPPADGRPAVKIPQIGIVAVGDDCEIGAGTTIDRAKFGATILGHRVKADNLVHIAHNCVVGDDSILCGRTTLGGSVTLGKRTVIGGAVTINDQAVVGDDARVAGGSIVMDAVPAGETYAGIPAMPARTALANHSAMRTLAEFMRRVDKALAKLTPKDESPATGQTANSANEHA
jgi:UDP-3-O-[3-hydroxymyristoyl] glucosamine N-acyltransferase